MIPPCNFVGLDVVKLQGGIITNQCSVEMPNCSRSDLALDIKLAERRLAREFGASLRHRRKTLGYTQEDLASMIGTNRRFISELERGKGTSYLGPALAAAEALGISISVLFEDHRGARPVLPEA